MSKLLTDLLILPSEAEMSSSVGDYLLDQDFQGALESVLHAGVIFIVGLLFRESIVRSRSSGFGDSVSLQESFIHLDYL